MYRPDASVPVGAITIVDTRVLDLDGHGRDELVAVDSRQSHVLEVLAGDPDSSWSSVLHFTVFDADPHFEGRPGTTQEPRELLLADLTGDGRVDVALLVHDRILVYPTLRR